MKYLKESTHDVISLVFVNFSDTIKNSLLDVCTPKDAVDTDSFQPGKDCVQFPEGTAELERT